LGTNGDLSEIEKWSKLAILVSFNDYGLILIDILDFRAGDGFSGE